VARRGLPGRVRGHVVGAAAQRVPAGELAERQREIRQVNRGGIHDHVRGLREVARNLKQPKGIAGGQRERAEAEQAALAAATAHDPGAFLFCAERDDDLAGLVPRQVGVVSDLHPQFGQAAQVPHGDPFFQGPPHLRAQGARVAREAEAVQPGPRPEQRNENQQPPQIEEVEEQVAPGDQRADEEGEKQHEGN